MPRRTPRHCRCCPSTTRLNRQCRCWSLASDEKFALTAWSLVPFDLDQAYTTNMGWTNVEGFPHLLFPGSARWVLAVDLVGLIAMVVRRNRVSLFVAVMAGVSAAVVCGTLSSST